MAEREELKIQVTLVDNATAGLRAMRQSLDELGGGKSAQNLENFRRRTQEAHDKGLKPFTEDLEDATKKMFPFVREIGGIATGMIAVGYAADKAVEALADFAKEQANIGKISEQTGFDPAAVKMMHETFARAGVGAKESSKDIAGFAHAMADVTRVNSEIRRKLFEGQKTGAEIEGMQSFFGDLVKFADDPTKFGNRVIEGYEQIKQNLLKRGETPERAAEGAQKFINQVFGVPDVTQLVQFHEKFKEVTKEDIERQNNRKQAAEEYLRTTNSIAESWDKINAAWWDQAITSSPLMTSMHWIDDMMKQWAETAEKQEKAAKEHPATFTEKINPFSEKGADYWRAQKKAAGQEDDISTAPLKKWWNDTFGSGAKPAPGGIQPLLSPGWGAGNAGGDVRGGLAPESWPLSSNIEDRRGEAPFQPGQDEEVKTQRELMEQTKRLAEDFERLFAEYGGAAGLAGLGGGGGGAGGAAPAGSLAAQAGLNDIGGAAGGTGGLGGAGGPLGILGGGLGVGGGPGGVPGMGALPGLGGGGGGGGGLPHGSDVGPGTGPGAGATLAGAGAAGVNAPAGGGGGGAGQSFVDQVKKFEGFEPKAKWDYKQYTSGYGTKAGYAGEPITREEAEKRLQSELGKAGQAVDAINPNLDAGTRSALTDLVFNAGPGALKGIKGAIASGDTAAIKQWLPEHYRTAGGKQLSALVERRAKEASWVGNKDFGGAPPGENAAAPPGSATPGKEGLQYNYFQKHGGYLSSEAEARSKLVSVDTPQGKILVNPAAAADFQDFAKEMKEAGAPIKKFGSFSFREKRWGGGQSSHAFGAALDVDDETHFSPAMKKWVLEHPDEWRAAMERHNLGQPLADKSGAGGKDEPHIEWRGPGSPFAMAQRAKLDSQMAQKVEGTGKLSVNVNAPKGTQVAAEGGGLFKKTEVTRQTQMEPAASSMASQYQE